MPIQLSEAVVLLLLSLVKSALAEGMFWADGKTDEEIQERAELEEKRTALLHTRAKGDDS